MIEENTKHKHIHIWIEKILPHLQKQEDAEQCSFMMVDQTSEFIFFLEQCYGDSSIQKINISTGEKYVYDFKLDEWLYFGGSSF